MFNVSDLSISLKSTKKSFTIHFNDTSLDLVTPNSLDILPKQN